jgi:hypothetical protein
MRESRFTDEQIIKVLKEHAAGIAIYYRDNGPEQRSAPAALCHLIEDTHAESGARHQSETTLEPRIRYHQINRIVRMFLGSLLVGGVELKVSDRAGLADDELLPVPTLLFGNDRKLEPADDGNDLDMVRNYSRLRLRTLEDRSAGFLNSPSRGLCCSMSSPL